MPSSIGYIFTKVLLVRRLFAKDVVIVCKISEWTKLLAKSKVLDCLGAELT